MVVDVVGDNEDVDDIELLHCLDEVLLLLPLLLLVFFKHRLIGWSQVVVVIFELFLFCI